MKIVAGCTLPLIDVADMYAEKIVTKNNKLFMNTTKIASSYREENNLNYLENGKLIPKTFTTYYTNHGPIMAKETEMDCFKIQQSLNESLEQSWMRTKSKSFEDYKKAMDLKANTSNNTVYADKEGNMHTGTEILFQ
jgi:acyl-homoserine lactone acylase PvdQ